MDSDQWPIPEDLDDHGRTAARIIVDFLRDNEITYHGGGGRLYSPQEWADRGEQYGTHSKLIVTYDGGAHAPAFNLDYEAFELHEKLQEALGAAGLYLEACTCWYSAVYTA